MTVKIMMMVIASILISIGIDLTRRISQKNKNIHEQNSNIKTSGVVSTTLGSIGVALILIGLGVAAYTGAIARLPKKLTLMFFLVFLVLLIIGSHTVATVNSSKSDDEKNDIYVRMAVAITSVATFVLGFGIGNLF